MNCAFSIMQSALLLQLGPLLNYGQPNSTPNTLKIFKLYRMITDLNVLSELGFAFKIIEFICFFFFVSLFYVEF